QHTVSRLLGKLARSRITWFKNFLIRIFIRHFNVDMSEAAEEDYTKFPSFNAFFTRSLKPDARVMPEDPHAVISPVDGFISEFGAIQDQQLFQAKGHTYNLMALLGGDHEMVSHFHNGMFLTAYLSPRDYHRVHMPSSGILKSMTHVPGSLFSVNPETVAGVPNLFARNERVVCFFESDHGPLAVILVGAIVVASIATQWHGIVTPPTRSLLQRWSYVNNPMRFQRGAEIGHFEVGSTAIVLYGKNAISWGEGLKAGQMLRLGQVIGAQITC
ncbi:MAG: phosphatidylserine decarboxylase, partial [Coxiellaceae bacterium]|nr:phosphatidylserine decarboxylase [Coxiellaceae bacterium]